MAANQITMLRATALVGGLSMGVSTTNFVPLGGAGLVTCATEANAQINCATAGILNNLAAYVASNSLTLASTTITSRIGGADGNQTISVAAGVTGAVYDTTHNDSLSDGSNVCIKIATGASGSGSIVFSDVTAAFAATTNTAVQWVFSTHSSFSTASATRYLSPAGNDASLGGNTSETNAQVQVDVAGTWRDLGVYISANARSSTTTFRGRVNGANGTQVISVTASSTGQFLDTTHTDSLSAGDLICYSMATGTGTGAITIENIWSTFEATASPSSVNVFGAAGVTHTGGNTRYLPYTGNAEVSATAEWLVPVYGAHKLSKMQIRLSANTLTGTLTVKSYVNGAQGAQTISISSGSTGLFQDTTNTDTIASGGTSMIQLTGGTSGSCTIQGVGMLVTDNGARGRTWVAAMM